MLVGALVMKREYMSAELIHFSVQQKVTQHCEMTELQSKIKFKKPQRWPGVEEAEES